MPKTQEKTNQFIEIKGARVHNLKNISINLSRNKLIVITGLSGSGKSSMAFDTLYAEGQRRYVESLSSYARQFLGRINKPEVDYIKGIPPAIAIEQKVNTRNSRSTVGTSTEIYDYLKLLFARIGKTHSPVSNKIVKRHSVTDVVNYISALEQGTKLYILSPFNTNGIPSKSLFETLINQGFTRIELNENVIWIEEIINNIHDFKKLVNFNLLIDRISVDHENSEFTTRIADSIQTAFFEGNGICSIKVFAEKESRTTKFSNKFEADGITFEEPSEHLFSFNNPIGACPLCEGYGQTIGIDEDLIIPNKNLSIYDDAITCWKGEKMQEWKDKLIYHASIFDFPIHKPFYQLTDAQKKLLWTGNKYFGGLNDFFKYVEENSYKIQYRVILSRYRGKTTCPSCNGSRLKKEASYVKIDNKTIQELVLMPISTLYKVILDFKLTEYEQSVSNRIFLEIKNRLQFLINVGLGYITLNRLSSSLSGGESQRINLATSLGSSLVGSLYILDEPSIGLHSKDTDLLIKVLKDLRDLGNTVIVVEHDEEIIKAADEIIDIGPLAGSNGGEVVFQGTQEELISSQISMTAKYLTGKEKIIVTSERRPWKNFIEIIGARENNLKNINVKFPLDVLTVITGVSGSGKSSLVKSILYPALKKYYGGSGERTGAFDTLQGDLKFISDIEFVDQNPIGKSSRSNPVTYIKAYDEIRKLFADQHISKHQGFTPGHFSFNVEGGRCEECQGDGIIKVEMQFMADVNLVCDSCKGMRFKPEILDVKYEGKNIFDVLEMTVDESIEFFCRKSNITEKRILEKLKPLIDVGLGYLKLGQPSSTLSGGECQRIKLASFLGKEALQPTIYVFDEPTTGLHFHDIKKLLATFNALINNGHTIIIIEHNMEIIKSADWIIDLGLEGGNNGGNIVFEGTPESLITHKKSHTAKYLKEKLM